MLGVTAGALVFPPVGTPGLSAYLISKLAAVKTLEFLAAENPNIFGRVWSILGYFGSRAPSRRCFLWILVSSSIYL